MLTSRWIVNSPVVAAGADWHRRFRRQSAIVNRIPRKHGRHSSRQPWTGSARKDGSLSRGARLHQSGSRLQASRRPRSCFGSTSSSDVRNELKSKDLPPRPWDSRQLALSCDSAPLTCSIPPRPLSREQKENLPILRVVLQQAESSGACKPQQRTRVPEVTVERERTSAPEHVTILVCVVQRASLQDAAVIARHDHHINAATSQVPRSSRDHFLSGARGYNIKRGHRVDNVELEVRSLELRCRLNAQPASTTVLLPSVHICTDGHTLALEKLRMLELPLCVYEVEFLMG